MIAKNTLYFFMMNENYYKDYKNLDEFQKDYNRGHGVMIVDINNLLMAVPLRSSLPAYMKKNSRHLFPYEIYTNEFGEKKLKALDFSKATVIEKKHINIATTYLFKDEQEKAFYLENFDRIALRLRNYIKKYISICEDINEGIDVGIHTLKPYVYSTLRNFHEQLSISLSRQQFIDILEEKFNV